MKFITLSISEPRRDNAVKDARPSGRKICVFAGDNRMGSPLPAEGM